MKHARVHRNNDYYMNATMRKLQMQLQGEHRNFFSAEEHDLPK